MYPAEIVEKAHGPDHADLIFPLEALAELYQKTGHSEEGQRTQERAKTLRLKHPAHPPSTP